MCYSRLLDGVSKITNIRNALDDHLKGKQPFSSEPDGDHPVGEIRRKCIEPGVNNCQRGSMGNFDHYACGNNVRGAGEACRRQGIAFLLMVVESFGG